MVQAFPVDYMHHVCLGVIKKAAINMDAGSEST